jgi:hypothetical protein
LRAAREQWEECRTTKGVGLGGVGERGVGGVRR